MGMKMKRLLGAKSDNDLTRHVLTQVAQVLGPNLTHDTSLWPV